MRGILLIAVLLISFPVFFEKTYAGQAETIMQRSLVKSIVIKGFVLGDKDRFVKIFKPYRHKRLTVADMDAMLKQVQDIYEREGYKQLVSITYKVNKHLLVYTASMIS